MTTIIITAVCFTMYLYRRSWRNTNEEKPQPRSEGEKTEEVVYGFQRGAQANFIERWMVSNEFRYTDDSTPEEWRYTIRLSLDTFVADVQFVLERSTGNFFGCVRYPIVFAPSHFDRVSAVIDAFNQAEAHWRLDLDKSNGLMRMNTVLSGEDIKTLGESCELDCIRFLLGKADNVFPQLLEVSYGYTIPEIAILRTVGLRSSLLN